MDTNGQNRQLIFQDAGAHFFGIDVDSQYIYVSDWTKEYVWFQIQSRSIQLNFAMNFSGSTTISLPNESEFCSAIWGHMYHSFDAYFKSFYFLIFFSGVIRLNKDGSGETPVGPPSFGKLNGISLYHQGGWFKCSYIKMTFNPGHFT